MAAVHLVKIMNNATGIASHFASWVHLFRVSEKPLPTCILPGSEDAEAQTVAKAGIHIPRPPAKDDGRLDQACVDLDLCSLLFLPFTTCIANLQLFMA